MFNRLPIYSRPKEPAIGRPTLTSSTNDSVIPSLNTQPHTIDLNGRIRNPSPALGPSSGNVGLHFDRDREFPPTPIASALENEPQVQKQRAPPRRPPRPEEPWFPSPSYPQRNESLATVRAPSPPIVQPNPPAIRKFNVARKPAPAPDVFDGSRARTGFAGTTISAGSAHTAPKASGFANLKEKLRRPSNARLSPSSGSDSDHEDFPPHLRGTGGIQTSAEVYDSDEPKTIKPTNLVSIDDWLTDREGLHKRSTMSTIATSRDIPSSREFLPIPEPTVPLVPAHFLSTSPPRSQMHPVAPHFKARVDVPFTAQLAGGGCGGVRHQNHPVRRDAPPRRDISAPPHTSSTHLPRKSSAPTPSPPSPPIEEKPKDRIARLEDEQESLEERKRALKKEIKELEMLLPPNPTSHNRGTREEMKEQMEILNNAVADVDKELHDLGMKLHRAYRRFEERSGKEGPTHLWISRVVTKGEK